MNASRSKVTENRMLLLISTQKSVRVKQVEVENSLACSVIFNHLLFVVV